MDPRRTKEPQAFVNSVSSVSSVVKVLTPYLRTIFLARARAIVTGCVTKIEICPNTLCGS